MDPLVPPPSSHHVLTLTGEAYIWRPCPHVVVQQATGVLSLPLAQCFADFYRPILVPGVRLQIFDDFEGLTFHERDARELLTALTLERLDNVIAIHFLLASKFLALGVSAFKHQIGDVHVVSYSDRASFLDAYTRAVQADAQGASAPTP